MLITLKVNTVLSENEDYTGIIGFTKEETYKFLKDYKMDNFAQKVKEHYDGYKFYDKEIFCPWDIVSFISDYYKKNLKGTLKLNRLENYWEGTTSDKSLSGYIGYLTDNDNQKMQDLVDGKSISFILNESMNYDCLSQHKSDDFWSLLLHTGYLTVDWEKTDEAELSNDSKTNKEIFARIPNLEILECFEHNIKTRFSSEFVKLNLHNKLVDALSCGNQKKLMTPSLICYKNMSQSEIQQLKLLSRITTMALSMVFLPVVKISSLTTTLIMSLVADILILPSK